MSDHSFAEFLGRYPDYAATSPLDNLRAREYARLDREGHVYLDYTGGGLYAESQVRRHADLLTASILGNPHSASLASTATTELVEAARRSVLAWFNASPAEYTAVFTLNATGALKHVAESYPFGPGGRYILTADNHNSVNGIREFARARGASLDYVPLTLPDLRIDRARLGALLAGADPSRPNLLAFPAQSNFSGVKHPLEIVDEAHGKGWDVLLDAAAFVPTSRLDLGAVKPDFVCLSFYKMFGYPTGVGCLLVRHSALGRLHRPWFAGGTVNFATVVGRTHILSPREAGFEDGTLNYLAHSRGGDRPAPPRGDRHRHDPDARPLADRLAARAAARAPPRQRASDGPHLRPGRQRQARRNRHAQLLRSRRPPARLPPHRGARERRAHLDQDRLFLQSGSGGRRPRG